MSRFILWFCFCGLIASSIVGCKKQLPASVLEITDDTTSNFYPADSTLFNYFSEKFPADEPGAAVLIKTDRRILMASGFGFSDMQTKEKVTAKTLFNLGSISKTFVSNAILILQAENKLSIEDDLLQYFPEFENKSIAQSVKIKHLLTHTSGLPDIRFPWKDSVFYLTARDQENWNPIMKTRKLNFEPGSKFEYSNPAFNALALIIEKTTGEKWQKFVSDRIFIPSGMISSTITDGPHPETGVAHGYLKSANGWIEKDYGEEPTFAAAGNGGVWSSAEELALYHEAIMKNVFLSREIQEDATTVKVFPNRMSEQKPFIGWAWFIAETKDGFKMIGHTGSQGGFRADFQYIPEKKWLIIILSTTPRNLEEHTHWVLNYLQTVQ